MGCSVQSLRPRTAGAVSAARQRTWGSGSSAPQWPRGIRVGLGGILIGPDDSSMPQRKVPPSPMEDPSGGNGGGGVDWRRGRGVWATGTLLLGCPHTMSQNVLHWHARHNSGGFKSGANCNTPSTWSTCRSSVRRGLRAAICVRATGSAGACTSEDLSMTCSRK